jgi:hypothetical protein
MEREVSMQSSTEQIEILTERLAVLEREVDRWRRQRRLWALGIACLLLGGARLSGPADKLSVRKLETAELVLRDEEGRPRASLITADSAKGGGAGGAIRATATSLVFFDAAGVERIRLRVDAEGFPSLAFRNEDSTRLITLEVDPSPSLSMFDGTGHRVRLYATPEHGGLSLHGPTGPLADLGAHGGSGHLGLMEGGQLRLRLGRRAGDAPKEDRFGLSILDGSGNVTRELP